MKKDFIQQCMQETMSAAKSTIPINEFTMAFCSKCFNPDCTRSMHGDTKFDYRTQNWESILFKDAKIIDKTDPLFDQLTNPNFIPIGASPKKPKAPNKGFVSKEPKKKENKPIEIEKQEDLIEKTMMNTPLQEKIIIQDSEKDTEEITIKPGQTFKFGE